MTQNLEIIKASAYQYQLAIQEQFTGICDPLFKLGIKHFIYGKAFQDGRYLILVNNVLYMKQYLESIKDHGKTFTKQMHNLKENQTHYHALSCEVYRTTIMIAC
jgi:hypothetical protein